MRTALLDCAALPDRAALHRCLAHGLRLPAWYGENLDALRDCLGDVQEETVLVLHNAPVLDARLGEYARRLRRVLTDAAAENPRFVWREE